MTTERTQIETVVAEFLQWRKDDIDSDLDFLDSRPGIYTTDDQERFVLLDTGRDVTDLLDYFVRMSEKTTLVLECFGKAVQLDITENEPPKNGTPIRVRVAVALDGSEVASGAYFEDSQIGTWVERGVGSGAMANEIERRLIECGRIEPKTDWHAEIERWLSDNMYDSIEEWAIDSDYGYNKHVHGWYNDEGSPVDLEEELIKAIEANQTENQ